jgi:hypothetical protein
MGRDLLIEPYLDQDASCEIDPIVGPAPSNQQDKG